MGINRYRIPEILVHFVLLAGAFALAFYLRLVSPDSIFQAEDIE